MGVFDMMEKYGHEQVIFNYDKRTGLKAIIAIHDTTLGPANGGCRMWDYKSEEEALEDALRLSYGMTYKSAAAGIMFGGGKTVIIGDPTRKTPEMFYALGRFVDTLHGRYYTGTDVGTTPQDFVEASKIARRFTGLPVEFGGCGNSGMITAYGVFQGMRACLREYYGEESFKGRKVSVQGVGKAGEPLIKYLQDAGAEIVAITDIDENKLYAVAKKYGVEAVDPEEIYEVECDIFSPNALGGVINDNTVEKLNCKIVAGAANNVLAESRHGARLKERNILYAPDFIINAGGIIAVADEFELGGFKLERALKKAEQIYERLLKVFAYAKEKDIPTQDAAEYLTEQLIESLAAIKRRWVNPE
ncbi:leucine dehydrogenase Ldh [Thermacetogenium phaeum DSM 12270]|uniref:Leucine dehydrogenase Ldh n=1 Tax=Thermacetogenium phaeum (strain ATCC BAA-254 / DSM 26808 / PB) TaxID=1089553 RepID=K4LF45_THEPS|nr:Glu/Leu/Phe/Val dehydrogenase dimerization domain-containing protein [Thermacetogenium phaeum]AFV10717.1 leucine dehydrogenase Ldh [Thermacetogenium phaeum DSM 12270]